MAGLVPTIHVLPRRNLDARLPAHLIRRWGSGASRARTKNFREKYNRSTMENARQLQCKALRGREKIRRRRNNGKQWKKQCAKQSEQSDIRAPHALGRVRL